MTSPRAASLAPGCQLGGTYSHASNHVMTTTTEKGVDTTSEMRQTQETPMKSPSFLGLLYYTLYTDRKGSMLDVLAGYGAGKTENNYLNDFSGQQSVQDMSADRYAFSGKAALHPGVRPAHAAPGRSRVR